MHHHSFWRTPAGAAAIGLIAVASYFLLTEHRQHLIGAFPYLLALSCPLMHLFMHKHHGHHHGAENSNEKQINDETER